ncbi:MAG: AMP-binding protein [Frankiaceae bacterium]|nr:AMP-binding protein [Frankiaceae bacterium]
MSGIGVAELIASRAADDSIGLVAGDQTWTWREVVAEAATRAQWLHEVLDPNRPANIGLLLDNTPDYVLTLFRAALAGTCVVGINATRRGTELERDIAHTDCQFVLSDHAHLGLRDPDSTIPTVLVEDTPWAPHAGAGLPTSLPDPNSLLLLIFTSGSTSAPKAVRRSSGRVAAAAPLGFSPDDGMYCAMPLIHGNALFGLLFPALAAGARIILREKFSASQWLDDVITQDATFTTSVGRALAYLLATPPSDADRNHMLKIVLAPETSPTDAAAFTERFGVPVVTGYGSSEGGITLLPSRRHGALGRAPAGTEITVLDPATGREQDVADIDENGLLRNPDRAIGELVRRDSTGSFEGYWGNPEADTDRVRDGWFYSGDLAYRDADGVFYFAGRVGDWLRVDSENFAAAPIERILGRYDGVDGVAVYGVPDAHSGDRVMAAVEVPDGTLDLDDFARWIDVQPDLGTKWAPTVVRLCERLPTVGHDKIDRRALQREAWLTADPIWWRDRRDGEFRRLDDAARDAIRSAFAEHGRSNLHPEDSRVG